MRTRRYVVQGPRPDTQATHSLGAYPQCTHFKAVKRAQHTLQGSKARTRGVLCVLPLVFSRRYCVIMVLARGIVLFYYYY